MAEPTLKKIYEKLIEIQSDIRNVETSEELLLKDENVLKDEEKQEVELLRKLYGRNQKKRFSNIQNWKAEIWENCPDKKTIEGNESFDFICKKTDKSCRFIDCYRNKVN